MCALCIVLTQLFFVSNSKGFFAETVHQNKYCGETEELTDFRHFFKTCNPLFPFRKVLKLASSTQGRYFEHDVKAKANHKPL